MKRYYLLLLCVGLILNACKENRSPKNSLSKLPPPSKLTVFEAGSEEEKAALADPYKGVSIGGSIQTGLYSIQETGLDMAPVREATQQLINSLSPAQKTASLYPIDSEEWRRWSNIDGYIYTREGVPLYDMSEEQRSLAMDLLAVALSPQGMSKAQDIMKMEAYLAYVTGQDKLMGGNHFWFTFMGEPSETEPWGWQYEGHHLIINYFVLGDQLVMTPTFMGSEPSLIESGENEGLKTFKAEEGLGLALYHSLNAAQKKQATLADNKPVNYNQAESYKDNAIVPYAGLAYSALASAQQRAFHTLVYEYIGNMPEDQAALKMAEIEAHLDQTYFAWIGADSQDEVFYYRIQSPVILIEFDHLKPVFFEGNKPTRAHIHTVVRTPNGNDYGKDLLRQHRERHHRD